jgi:hypothetical protein
MFSNVFEQRDKKISLLTKLGDCIGRSIRENVFLFSIDGMNEKVTYLTESNNVITGDFKIDSDVSITNIKVQDADIFNDNERFDGFVNEKVNSFIENIHYGELGAADSAFSNILELWEKRVKLDAVQSKLHEKTERLRSIENIVESEEFGQFLELRPQIVSFLKENLDTISQIAEIKNAVNLSNSVSTAFNFPRLTLEDLEKGETYILKNGNQNSIYEMICRQELVKKELLESKKEFSLTWANNNSIKNLASMIFEKKEAIVEALAAAIREVPYVALASKKSLFETFKNSLGKVDGLGVSDGDIKQYASLIFEIKKEAKDVLINSINEKYGVNIQNLQDPASFKSLVNTQVVIFEALSRLSPKGSLLREVITEMALSLKNKTGVQAIDVNDVIYEMFLEAGYEQCLDESTTLEDYTEVDFKRMTKELGYSETLEAIEEQKDEEYSDDESTEEEPEAEPEEAVEDEVEEEEAEESEKEVKDKEDVIKNMKDVEDVIDMITQELSDEEEDSE